MDKDVASGGARHGTARYDFFIAHSSEDVQAAQTLWNLLNATNKTFLASQSLVPGERWDVLVPAAQATSRITVALITRNTGEAFYQRDEIAYAVELHRRQDNNHRFIPVFLDSDPDTASLPYGVRTIHGLVASTTGGLRGVATELIQILDTTPNPNEVRRAELAALDRAGELRTASETVRDDDPHEALRLALEAYALSGDRNGVAFLEQAHRRVKSHVLPPLGARDLSNGPWFAPDREVCVYGYREHSIETSTEGIVVCRGNDAVREIRDAAIFTASKSPWSPNGALFCIRDSTGLAHLHDRDGTSVATLDQRGPFAWLGMVPDLHDHYWSPSSDRLVTRPGMRGDVSLWDTSGNRLAKIAAPRREARKLTPPRVTWSPNGALTAFDYVGTVRTIYSKDGERLAILDGVVAFSADGRFTCGEGDSCRFYSQRAEPVGQLQGSMLLDGWNPVRNCGLFEPRGTSQTVLVDGDARVLRDVYDRRLSWARWSATGDRVMAFADDTLTVFDLDRDQIVARRAERRLNEHDVHWSPNGRVVVVFRPRAVELWDEGLNLVASIAVEHVGTLRTATWDGESSVVLVKPNDNQWFVATNGGEVMMEIRSGPDHRDSLQDVGWGSVGGDLLLYGFHRVQTAPWNPRALVASCQEILRRNDRLKA